VYALAADWTSYIGPGKLFQANIVHGVATSEDCGSLSRLLHIHHTDRTFLFKHGLFALMVILHGDIETALTCITVEKVILATNSTDTTAITMVDLLC